MELLDTDIIRVERDGPGSAQAHVQRPGIWPEGWIDELPAFELFTRAGLDFGSLPGSHCPSPGCQNLAYSILRACCGVAVARQWRMWFAQAVVMGGKEPRWEISVGDVRGRVECGEAWFERSTPECRERAATFDGMVHQTWNPPVELTRTC